MAARIRELEAQVAEGVRRLARAEESLAEEQKARWRLEVAPNLYTTVLLTIILPHGHTTTRPHYYTHPSVSAQPLEDGATPL